MSLFTFSVILWNHETIFRSYEILSYFIQPTCYSVEHIPILPVCQALIHRFVLRIDIYKCINTSIDLSFLIRKWKKKDRTTPKVESDQPHFATCCIKNYYVIDILSCTGVFNWRYSFNWYTDWPDWSTYHAYIIIITLIKCGKKVI